MVALDAETGEVEWTFFVVPRPGEFGHDTWPQDNDNWEFGGGGVWLQGTVDPDLGMVYFSTGNPVPMFGGELREGDNLFTASVLALDIEDGRAAVALPGGASRYLGRRHRPRRCCCTTSRWTANR